MAEHITLATQFKSQKDGASTAAVMQAISFTLQEQKTRAMKKFLMFFVIASVCILIPIAHFFLVPGFLIGGIIAAKRLWNRASEGIDAKGTCPACNKQITLNLDKNGELPQWHDCPECGDALELQAAASE